MIDILQKITNQRTARNWTEYQLALRSGLPQSTISSWYRKEMLPSLPSLEKICNAFDMSMAQFLSDGNFTELSPSQKELLDKWELLTPSQKTAILELLRTIVD
ncbi:helix-turn-helix domain-containing protein [Lacrimispora sp. 210928-DFI.3.58]|uniref:helix-turn-helix domain-containing protein n=1 Tax=Lacrimispora sp. 210928-DFI.3.58 TaxID=2883214 RepID=UPI001D06CCE7|nr:helix-turn-helix transcriptional regulator [Lacrimispora sp. 210928-DFI.3.58]MCB7318597.1 helix-turn-helix transcriptional regulator [Lacrimispora sp. 210928-DFI.3.58]